MGPSLDLVPASQLRGLEHFADSPTKPAHDWGKKFPKRKLVLLEEGEMEVRQVEITKVHWTF